MKNKFTGEILISLLLVGLLVLFINPLEVLMPIPLHTLMIPVLLILFIIFTSLLWKETPGDERVQLHKFIASRFAYFAGITTLVIGITLQSFHHVLDPWLVLAVCSMLLARIVGLVYGYLRY